MGKIKEDGEIVEVQEDGQTFINLDKIEENLDDVNGNPQVVESLKQIIKYLKTER